MLSYPRPETYTNPDHGVIRNKREVYGMLDVCEWSFQMENRLRKRVILQKYYKKNLKRRIIRNDFTLNILVIYQIYSLYVVQSNGYQGAPRNPNRFNEHNKFVCKQKERMKKKKC